MSNAYQLIWFRQDLRIHDHAALWHASQQGPSLGLVILSPEQWKQRRCSNKNKFLFTTTQNASERVSSTYSTSYSSHSLLEEIANFISDFSKKYNIENVYANIEIGVNELKEIKRYKTI